MDTPGRFHLAAHETNYLSQKTRFRPSSDETNLINVITRCNEAECLTGRQGGDVDILIISALIPDYWPLLAGLTMAVALALV